MRQGSLPAVIAAPITSSEDLPAGISCADTFSFGCALFHAATACLPQATSCALFEYQILMGPWASLAPLPDDPPSLPQAVAAPAKTVSDAAIRTRNFISSPCGSGLVSPGVRPVWVERSRR